MVFGYDDPVDLYLDVVMNIGTLGTSSFTDRPGVLEYVFDITIGRRIENRNQRFLDNLAARVESGELPISPGGNE
jgi:hypothetical protein